MADFTYDGAGVAPASGKMASVTNWAGAAVSLALIAGIGVWGYKVIARDVSGVPIVQAMSGPMRFAPVDPGGTLADHQGLAVNAVAGQGAAAGPADQLMLAPRPAGLQADDVALGALAPTTVEPEFQPSLAHNAEIVEIEPKAAPIAESDPADGDDPLLALANQIAKQSKPLSPVSPSDGAQDEVLAALAAIPAGTIVTPEPESTLKQATFDGPGLRRSLRPKVRPAGLSAVQRTAAPVAAPAAATVKEIDPETLAAGTRLVQIGAFDSPEAARTEWTRLDAIFGDYLEGKDRVIQKATSGGRVFYRLRAHGFEDLADSRRFCAAFVARDVDCIPAVAR
ncbi:SPOR domain-containing protein [Antarctobacter jejuensis]|uniref:SPOR domain-containing protein n=1 Tax=Antarctobacter jejuensis TaxID=1439938 RepID=UPI003FD3E7D1